MSRVCSQHSLVLSVVDEGSVVTGEAPWVVRLTEIKQKAAVNLEAEHKVSRLNEELQSLMRSIRQRVRLSFAVVPISIAN